MNKWILCLCSLLPFCSWSAASSPSSELEMIEEELQVFKDRLYQHRLKEMKEEVEGQGLMIADWDAYAKELQLIRKQEEEDNQIKQQIKKLEERKAYLIKQQT